jgi:hypothetical protein
MYLKTFMLMSALLVQSFVPMRAVVAESYTTRTLATHPLLYTDARGVSTLVATVAPLEICGSQTIMPRDLEGVTKQLQNAIKTCSYGKMRLNATILRNPVAVQTSQCWNTRSSCDFEGWADMADRNAASLFPRQKSLTIYVLPNGTGCSWAGLGYVSCVPRGVSTGMRCRTWVTGEVSPGISAYVHEIGHNLGLTHAHAGVSGGPGFEYGDASCAMGFCCWSRCFNAPHREQLGWAWGGLVLNQNSLPAGRWLKLKLADSRLGAASYLRLEGSGGWIYVDLRRIAKPVDDEIPPAFGNAVNIHVTPIGNELGASTTYLTSLRFAQQSWTGYGLTIQLLEDISQDNNEPPTPVHVNVMRT